MLRYSMNSRLLFINLNFDQLTPMSDVDAHAVKPEGKEESLLRSRGWRKTAYQV